MALGVITSLKAMANAGKMVRGRGGGGWRAICGPLPPAKDVGASHST
jgi:hypothetical protein